MSIDLLLAYHRTRVFTMDTNPQFFVTGDSLEYHHNKPFSTTDFDHSRGHCTSRNPGAWWFDWCANSNLNGIYGPGLGYKYIMWDQWLGLKALAGTKMMIRPVNFISGTNYVLKRISLMLPILIRFLAPLSIHRRLAHCLQLRYCLIPSVFSRHWI